jgi:hypothetical protein
MKYYLVVLVVNIVFFAAATSLRAQQDLQDVVYLKNGSVIRGLITQQIPNKTLTIQTTDGNVFVWAVDDIEKITKERPINTQPVAPPTNATTTTTPLDEKKDHTKDRRVIIYLGQPINRFSQYFVPGVHYLGTLSTFGGLSYGCGAGIESISKTILISPLLTATLNLSNSDFRPYLYGDLGYTHETGINLLLGLGGRLSSSDYYDVTADLSIKHQTRFSLDMNILALSLGVAF